MSFMRTVYDRTIDVDESQFVIDSYIECSNCGFCLLGEVSASPAPKRVDSCPGCGSTNFEFFE